MTNSKFKTYSAMKGRKPEEEIDDEETEVNLLNHHPYHHMGQKLEKSVRMFCMSASRRVNQWVGRLRQAKI